MRARARWSPTLAALVLAGTLAGCDDQIKYVPVFSTMSEQPSVEAFEAAPRTPVPGTMAVDGEPSYSLIVADTAAINPLAGTASDVERGAELFSYFCTPCHGPEGAGDGSVTGPNRIPTVDQLPTLNLLTQQARDYTDGYLWGMITNGRGLMPGYRRIPSLDRWYIVTHVRDLQRTSPVAGAVGGEGASSAGDGGGASPAGGGG